MGVVRVSLTRVVSCPVCGELVSTVVVRSAFGFGAELGAGGWVCVECYQRYACGEDAAMVGAVLGEAPPGAVEA
jgi:C4-type Zn-finger protein